MRIWCLALLLAAAQPVWSEEPIDGDTFEAMSTGTTMEFGRGGTWYGAEQYLPDRQVVWKYADGTCTYGEWFERNGALCFVYEDNPVPQCWVVTRRNNDIFVRPEGTGPQSPSELTVTSESTEPLDCPAPDLGV
ncbi:MAG: hypothetical protein AAF813_07055 [Pseudomonadota bacterium]